MKQNFRFIICSLTVLLILTALISIYLGAVKISLTEMLNGFYKVITSSENLTLNERIFLELRLPRVVLCFGVGGALAIGGAMIQALFRNPIVEPGLIGTSSGAAFGASFFIVFGSMLHLNVSSFALPITAIIGAIIATSIIFSLSFGKKSVITILLIGIAINALFLSGIGIFSYIARDPQARSITFWSLGTMSGANWTSASTVILITLVGFLFSLRLSKQLNAVAMGDDEATFIGVNVRKLKYQTLFLNVIIVSVSTAFVGVISFVGLIIPHIARLLIGGDNRKILMASILIGGIFLCLADLFSRILFAPAELPIGIVTSFVGAPLFIYLIKRNNYFF